MYFVYSPSYDYEEEPTLQEFKTSSEVTAFIEKDIKRNETGTYHNTVHDYTVIEGTRLKVDVVEYVSKVEITK